MSYYIKPERIKRVLVFAHMGIGNLIMFIPTIQLFKTHFKWAKFSMVVSPKHLSTFKELLESYAGLIDEFIGFNGSHASPVEKIRFIKTIRSLKFDMLIKNFLGGINFILPILRIPYRVGHISSLDFPIRFGRVFNYPVHMEKDEHEIHRNLRLFCEICNKEVSREFSIQFDIPESATQQADRILGVKVGVQNFEPLHIAMQIGSSAVRDWKEWAPEKFGELAYKLISEYKVKGVLLGDSRAKTKGEIVASRIFHTTPYTLHPTPLINLIGKTSILEAAAVIKRCKLLVSNDAGLMWIAQAVGTPVVAIYGPTDYKRTGPIGLKDKIIRKDLPCSPCYKSPTDFKRAVSCRHRRCLLEISVEDVTSTISENLRQI